MAIKNVLEKLTAQQGGIPYIDVPLVPEFEQCHPAGAVNIPFLHFDERTGRCRRTRSSSRWSARIFPVDTKLLVGCQVGARSAQAGQFLARAGFTT